MKRISTTLILLFFYLSLFSQYTISGTIVSANKKPIEFTSVSIFPTKDSADIKGVISNKDGMFRIVDLQNDNYQLTIQMLGYEDHVIQITISEDIDIGMIKVKEETALLGEIEVVAEQSTLESRLGKKVLRIGQDLTLAGSSAFEALENIPSVTTTQSGQVQIRGNSNVIVYINGKETRRDPATLKYISAEVLEKIEVITNPSAKYDAEGVGGIINVVYKKGRTSKFKLEAIANASFVTDPFNFSPNVGLNASLAKDKISFFTNVSLDLDQYVDNFNSRRENYSDSLQLYENEVRMEGNGYVGNFNLGLEYEIDSTLSMALELNYDRWFFEDESTQVNRFNYANDFSEVVEFKNDNSEIEDEVWINYSFEKKLKSKSVIKVSLTAGGEDEENMYRSNDSDANPELIDLFLLSSDETESQRYYQGKLDYEKPFFKFGRLEAGVKADFIRYTILQTSKLRSETITVPDNDFNMDMQKLGVYLLQKHQIKRFEYAVGLRLEQFSSEAIQYSNQEKFTQDYLRLFPSVQFNFLLPDPSHTIGFNYTRRINRPGFFDINPFISYSDPLNLETGNPALRPEIANLYELAYHKEMNKIGFDLTLYRRVTSDAIQETVQTLGNNQSLEKPVNFSEATSQGIEGQLEYRPHKIFTTTISMTWRQTFFSDSENSVTFNGNATWGLRGKQQLRLSNNWKVELSEIYRAPRYSAQRKMHENFYVNLAVSKKFNNSRGSISLGVRDMFNTRQYAYSLQTETFEVERRDKWQTRKITLGLRYFIFEGK